MTLTRTPGRRALFWVAAVIILCLLGVMSYINDSSASASVSTSSVKKVPARTAPAPASPAGLYQTAKGLAHQSRCSDAIQAYARALTMDPSFVSAYVGEADCYKSLGSYNQAITAYSQAIKADPANPALYVGRSGIYQLNGESGHASEDCASAEKHSVPTIATAEQIATCYATTENYGAESSALARALKHFPTSSDLYRTKSSVDQVTGDTQAALADYEQAFALARSAAQQGQALSTGGDLYASQGDYAGAVAEYKEATKVAPFLIDPWVGLATALATEGQTEPAADVYEAAERAPGMTANSRALVYRAHGNLLQQLGDQGKAVTAWRTALRLTTDPALRAQLRQTLASVGA